MSRQASELTQERSIESVLIVGGGTAGWLTAAILASRQPFERALKISLIEAPDVPIIGVGEGTWPSMRRTLHNAGIKESDFVKQCDAAFKQGSKFIGWNNGAVDDFYYHPYDLPQDFFDTNMAQHWVDTAPQSSFSKWACVQEHLCELDLSPKLKHSSPYSGVSNYGYHLNAGKFSEFLKQHCIDKFGVELVLDKVTDVVNIASGECAGDIGHVTTAGGLELSADLFIDCTGFRSLLLGQHFGVDLIDQSAQFPINSALAVQVPYKGEEAIKSATLSTAQDAGWIWDIGLSTRRGVGHVYSNSHSTEEQAVKDLQAYLGLDDAEFEKLALKNLKITPGYRQEFWHKNCVAIGLSAGFLEPLEASAMMLIENSANMLVDLMPSNRAAMDVIAKRFNRKHHYLWERVIDFLKLHYALTAREQPFWRDAASELTLSDRLLEDMALWRYQAPWKSEFNNTLEAFPEASYQYVLYGMGFKTLVHQPPSAKGSATAQEVVQQARLLSSKVENNRAILELIKAN